MIELKQLLKFSSSSQGKMKNFFSQEPEYAQVSDEEYEKSPDSDYLRTRAQPSRPRLCLVLFPWILSLLLGCLSAYLYLTRPEVPVLVESPVASQVASPVPVKVAEHGTFETGFDHEFGPARPHLSVYEKKFFGTSIWFDNGTYYLTRDPNTPNYVGEPTDEIDAAWEELIKDRFFFLTEAEAKEQFPTNYRDFWSENSQSYNGYVDAMHVLHCLNRIRQSLHRERYASEWENGQLDYMTHNYHCIEVIRQSLMCHADLTIVPVRYYKSLGHGYIDSDQTHTCRNFTKIQEWVWSRKKMPNEHTVTIDHISEGH